MAAVSAAGIGALPIPGMHAVALGLLWKGGCLEDKGTRDHLLERSEEMRRLWDDDLSREL